MPTQHDGNQMTDKQIKDLMERSPMFEELWDTYVFAFRDTDFAEGTELHQIKHHAGFRVFLAGARHLEEQQHSPVEHLAAMVTVIYDEIDALMEEGYEPTGLRSEWAVGYLQEDEFLTDLEGGAVLLAAGREEPQDLIPEELELRRAKMSAPDLFGLEVRNEMPPMVALSRDIERAINPEGDMMTSPVFGTAWYQYRDEVSDIRWLADPGHRVFIAGAEVVAAKDQAERRVHLDTMLRVVRKEAGAARKSGEELGDLRSQRAVTLLHENGHLTDEEAAALSVAGQ